MVAWWGNYSYFNRELIQIGDVEIMTSAYGLSGSFVARVSSKQICFFNKDIIQKTIL